MAAINNAEALVPPPTILSDDAIEALDQYLAEPPSGAEARVMDEALAAFDRRFGVAS